MTFKVKVLPPLELDLSASIPDTHDGNVWRDFDMVSYHSGMRIVRLLGLLASVAAEAQTPAARLWDELRPKREKLSGVHQEFEVVTKFTAGAEDRVTRNYLLLDLSEGRWRTQFSDRSGNHTKLFDGRILFQLEGGSDEYVRVMHPTTRESAPLPYSLGDIDMDKVVEIERRPCGLRDPDHVCVVLDLPLLPSVEGRGLGTLEMAKSGIFRVAVDTETGLLLSSRLQTSYQLANRTIKLDVVSTGRRLRVGAPMRDGIFELPPGDMREVKALALWDAAGMRKQLVGKQAPEIVARDLEGRPIRLSAMRGRLVVLSGAGLWNDLVQAMPSAAARFGKSLSGPRRKAARDYRLVRE